MAVVWIFIVVAVEPGTDLWPWPWWVWLDAVWLAGALGNEVRLWWRARCAEWSQRAASRH